MPHKATIESLPRAFEMVKAMQADGLKWGEGYCRSAGRHGRVHRGTDGQGGRGPSEQLEADAADRRNGYYQRHLLTELGDIELNVPRTRRYSPVEVIRAYARRTPEIDRVILSAFVLGLSTRKVGETLLAILGRPISAETVSQVAKTFDVAVAVFHRRPLQNRYQVLMLDGVVLGRKTDFRLAGTESAAEWEKRSLPSRAHRRGPRHGLRRWWPACWLPCRSPCMAFPCSAAGLTRSGTSSTKSARPTSPTSSAHSTRS